MKEASRAEAGGLKTGGVAIVEHRGVSQPPRGRSAAAAANSPRVVFFLSRSRLCAPVLFLPLFHPQPKSVQNLLTSSRSLLSGRHEGMCGARGLGGASRAAVVRGDNVTSLFFAERN